MVSPPTRSRLRRTTWYTALFVTATVLFLPPSAGARLMLSDNTPPTVTYTVDGIDGNNGWYRGSAGGNFIVVHWSVSDPESPIISTTGCEPAIQINGPNTGTTRTCSATSDGGTTTVTTRLLKIDATPPGTTAVPSRQPNSAGWYHAPLSISWTGVDPTSGIASCRAALAYAGPDTTGTAETGSCTDNAGNSSSDAFTVRYDTVAPTTVATPSRAPNGAGWYRAPFSIDWVGSDATSGLAACSAILAYGGPDTTGTAETGSCTDNAGNSSSDTFTVRYDTAAPAASAAPARAPDANGWYDHALRIAWSGSDPVSGIASCSALSYGGPDGGSISRSGGCTDRAGNASPPSVFRFRFDSTAPSAVGVAPARPPDHDGWYNHPLGIRWSGVDATAGIAACTALTYGSPGATGGQLTGRCTDQAGNASAPLGFALRYDESPPALTSLALKPLDGAVALRWRVTGAAVVVLSRALASETATSTDVYSGGGGAFTDKAAENYVRYRYTLTASDAAGNVVHRSGFATPRPVLFAPRPGAHLRVHARPLFAWRPTKRARYYNVQLWRAGTRIGSWWPAAPRLRLPSRWTADGVAQRLDAAAGVAQRLDAGGYTWYVWPGRGARRLGRYGPLLGKSTFAVG